MRAGTACTATLMTENSVTSTECARCATRTRCIVFEIRFVDANHLEANRCTITTPKTDDDPTPAGTCGEGAPIDGGDKKGLEEDCEDDNECESGKLPFAELSNSHVCGEDGIARLRTLVTLP